jgi:hypothetical protein
MCKRQPGAEKCCPLLMIVMQYASALLISSTPQSGVDGYGSVWV